MAAQSKVPLAGYPQYFGTKHFFAAEVNGPALYATGGQQINTTDFGMGGFDLVDAGQGLSYSGTYFCRIQYLPIKAAPSTSKPGVQHVKLLWYVLSTGAEVAAAVDLSGEIVRISVLGD